MLVVAVRVPEDSVEVVGAAIIVSYAVTIQEENLGIVSLAYRVGGCESDDATA